MFDAQSRRRVISLLCLSTICLVDACGGSSRLVSLYVTPVTPTIAVGTSQQFKAIGTYGDNSTQDVTASVIWWSSVPSVAAITSGGLATGENPGTATIVAALGPIDAAVGLNVVVTPAFLPAPAGSGCLNALALGFAASPGNSVALHPSRS